VTDHCNRGKNGYDRQDIIAGADFKAEGAIQVLVEIAGVGVHQRAALENQENEREGKGEVLGSPSLQHVLHGIIQSHGVMCLQGFQESW
jgi:hypothetical protein